MLMGPEEVDAVEFGNLDSGDLDCSDMDLSATELSGAAGFMVSMKLSTQSQKHKSYHIPHADQGIARHTMTDF